MFGLGISEIVVIAVLGLVLIGPDQLPEVARTVARFLNDLRRNTDEFTKDFKNQVKIDPINFNEINEPVKNPGATDEIIGPALEAAAHEELPAHTPDTLEIFKLHDSGVKSSTDGDDSGNKPS